MKKINYINITNDFLYKECDKYSSIKFFKKGESYIFRKKKYFFDDHHIKYDFNQSEINFIKWLSKRINKKIVLIPKICYPLGIKTPDFRIGNTYYDLKTIHGNSKQIIYHRIRGYENQANCFFFDATNSSLSITKLISQVNDIFGSSNPDRTWVKIIAIKKKNKLIVLKKNDNALRKVAGITVSLNILYS